MMPVVLDEVHGNTARSERPSEELGAHVDARELVGFEPPELQGPRALDALVNRIRVRQR